MWFNYLVYFDKQLFETQQPPTRSCLKLNKKLFSVGVLEASLSLYDWWQIEQNTRFSLNGVQVATLDFFRLSMFRVDPRVLSIRVQSNSTCVCFRFIYSGSRSANFPVVHSVRLAVDCKGISIRYLISRWPRSAGWTIRGLLESV